MRADISIIYRIILIDKIKLYKEFTNNKTMMGVGLADKIITAYKNQGDYYTSKKDPEFLGIMIKFLAEHYDEPSNKRHILYNV
jgi:hypothetical protein